MHYFPGQCTREDGQVLGTSIRHDKISFLLVFRAENRRRTIVNIGDENSTNSKNVLKW